MRLIDADALEKEIYKWMPKDQESWMDSEIPPIENLVVSIMMTIQEQETIDAVPVIRCKDCNHSLSGIDKYNRQYILCTRHENSYGVKENGFCAWAERKEE